jgi:hypothetical protein
MHRRNLLKSAAATAFATILPASAQPVQQSSDRTFYLSQLDRVANPVLTALSRGLLKATMPVEAAPGEEASRRKVTHLEAFGRTLSGISPWLESTPTNATEAKLHAHYLDLTQKSILSTLDPQSPDHLDFAAGAQNVVDAGFLALAILRAPTVLNKSLDAPTRKQLADALRLTRQFKPPVSNWLLFAAAIEAALHALNEPWDRTRVDYALREHMAWFLGDGTYGDGPHFHSDYYNSFVIHPFLLAVLGEVAHENPDWQAMLPAVHQRAIRYAHTQERLIAPDGTYPAIGRSITYRCGAFHLLADTALRHMLPEDLSPAQTRCALAAVIHRTLSAPNTFDKDGWLLIGLAGHQPSLGETYISTGSLYLCTNAFLPLGLPSSDSFWSTPAVPWSSQKLWTGADLPNDHAIDA